MLMICVMSSPVKFSTFFMGKLKKGCMFRKFFKKYALAQLYELFQVLQEISTKIKFSESNFLEVYAVVHYRMTTHHKSTVLPFWLLCQ